MSNTKWRFDIEAMPSPQSLPRVIDHFAQRSVVPIEMSMRVAGDIIHITILTYDLPAAHAEIIAGKLAELFVIFDCRLTAAESSLQD